MIQSTSIIFASTGVCDAFYSTTLDLRNKNMLLLDLTYTKVDLRCTKIKGGNKISTYTQKMVKIDLRCTKIKDGNKIK